MARLDIVMPQMGESITNGTITKWHKKAGDSVALDEILFEISTDKVESEIPSPFEGRLEEILFPEGAVVNVGVKVATLEDDRKVPFKGGSAPAVVTMKVAQSTSPVTHKTQEVAESVPNRRFYTPLVKSLAQKHNIPLSDLASIQGTGHGGRVTKDDLMKFIELGPKTSIKPAPSPSISTTTALPSSGRVEVINMDNMRKAIARNMVLSKQTSPHVNSISEVDLTHLVKFRESFKDKFAKEEGFKLTYTPFIIYALVEALKKFPLVNSSVDGEKIIIKKDINIGCAVAVPGHGLVVPVIHNAEAMNLRGLARKINTLAEKARAKKLTLDELQGGTFTFTNVGSFGTLLATPIILQPQVGIYAAGVIQKRVVVTDEDAIAIRSMMYGTHTYDHRVIDGELGGKFLEAVHEVLRKMGPAALF